MSCLLSNYQKVLQVNLYLSLTEKPQISYLTNSWKCRKEMIFQQAISLEPNTLCDVQSNITIVVADKRTSEPPFFSSSSFESSFLLFPFFTDISYSLLFFLNFFSITNDSSQFCSSPILLSLDWSLLFSVLTNLTFHLHQSTKPSSAVLIHHSQQV